MAAGDSEMHAALSEFAPDWTEVVAIVSAHGNEVTSVRAGPDSDTPLHSACYWGALDAITVLLSAGADANAKNDAGATPLHLCALNHQPGAARLLLASGARVNEPEASDAAFTPLHTACSVGDAVTAGVLVEMGADPVSPLLGNGNTPLHVAAREGFNDVVELLAKACPKSVGVRNVAQETAIHRAAAHGQEDICASLVELGADVRAVDGNGDSALHLAAMFGMTQTAVRLVDLGAALDGVDEDKQTPLHLAAMARQGDTCKELIELGAKTDVKNEEGRTALEVCAANSIDAGAV